MGIPKQLQAEVDVLESLHEGLELEVAPPQCSETEELSQKIEVLRRRFDTCSVEGIIHDLAWWQLRAELLSKKMGELSAVDPECDGCVRLRSELESVRSELNYERTYKADCVKRVTLAEDALSGLERYLAWKADDDI